MGERLVFTLTDSGWYNSDRFSISYRRIYKSASSSFVALLGDVRPEPRPRYDRRFAVIRDPFARSFSVWKELKARLYPQLEPYPDYLERTLADGYFDKHQLPQSHWLRGFEDTTALFDLDRVGDCLEWIGAKPDALPVLNKRAGTHEHGDREREIVRRLYSDDFELLWRIL